MPTSPEGEALTPMELVFQFSILDPCEEPQFIARFTDVAAVTYTLGDPSLAIATTWAIWPATTATAACAVTYDAGIATVIGTTPAADQRVTFDQSTKTFTVQQATDTSMAGVHTLVVTPRTAGGNPMQV